jgi:hypothetical protein
LPRIHRTLSSEGEHTRLAVSYKNS